MLLSKFYRLGDGFFSMPNEIQVEILCCLQASDILSLRLTSRSMLELLGINASVLTRVILGKSALGNDPFYLKELYPLEKKQEDLSFLLHMMHREKIVSKMIYTIGEYIERKVEGIKTQYGHDEFAPSRDRLQRRLQKPVAIIYHYLEQYRIGLAKRMQDIKTDKTLALSAKKNGIDVYIQEDIVRAVPHHLFIQVFNAYRILIAGLRQKVRPPTYAGTIERKLRGWDGTPATDADVSLIVLCGGMEDILKIMRGRKYSSRMETLVTATRKFAPGNELDGPKIVKDFYTHLPWQAVQALSERMDNICLSNLYTPWFRVYVRRHNAPTAEEAKRLGESIQSPFDYLEELLGEKEPSTGPDNPNQ